MRYYPFPLGPRQARPQETFAWVGITAQGEKMREKNLRWRRRQKQMIKNAASRARDA